MSISKKGIRDLNLDLLLTTFQGRSIFFIFFDEIAIYRAIFETIEQLVRISGKNNATNKLFLRRLFRILLLGTPEDDSYR